MFSLANVINGAIYAPMGDTYAYAAGKFEFIWHWPNSGIGTHSVNSTRPVSYAKQPASYVTLQTR